MPPAARSRSVILSHHPRRGWMLSGWRVRLDAVRTTVAGVLLAAGEGFRFGQPKALVKLNGQTLAERGVGLLRAGGANPILVVTGAVPLELDGTLTAPNPHCPTGMAPSPLPALPPL